MKREASKTGAPTPWYFQQNVVQSYESWYTGKGERMDRQEKNLLGSLLGSFGAVKGLSLLEVGCGTAHFTRWFESLGVAVTGMDLSPLMLKEARKYWSGKLLMGDAAALPFAAQSFDVVAYITCFEYMPDPIAVLREGTRVARKGVLMGLMNRWSLPTLRRWIQEKLGKTPFFTNAHFYSLPEIKQVWERALGRDRFAMRWRCTLFPPFLPVENAAIPLGAFLALSVRFPDEKGKGSDG